MVSMDFLDPKETVVATETDVAMVSMDFQAPKENEDWMAFLV